MSEKNLLPILGKNSKPVKLPKLSKKVKRGAIIHERHSSVSKINIFRDKLIEFSGNLNVFLALCLIASAGMNAWIITQPHMPSPFYIQYTTGQIAPINLYNKDRLPPPLPLDVQPVPAHARLDDSHVYQTNPLPDEHALPAGSSPLEPAPR